MTDRKQTADEPTVRKRVRLKPQVRVRQILDAALTEFSLAGFAAARMEDIAARVGMSKSGLYAHYRSKEDIFQALVETILSGSPIDAFGMAPDSSLSLSELLDRYLEDVYERMQKPQLLLLMRLLVTESSRLPTQIRRLYVEALTAYRAREQAALDLLLARGVIRPGVLSEHFAFAIAPAVQWALAQIAFEDQAPIPLEQVRQIHKRMLMELLQPT